MRSVAILLLLAALVGAAEAADARRGLALARKTCSPCHAVEATGDSPNPRSPPFRDVAKRYPPEQLEEALGEGIMVRHGAIMPEFRLSPRSIDDLVAYLNVLRRR